MSCEKKSSKSEYVRYSWLQLYIMFSSLTMRDKEAFRYYASTSRGRGQERRENRPMLITPKYDRQKWSIMLTEEGGGGSRNFQISRIFQILLMWTLPKENIIKYDRWSRGTVPTTQVGLERAWEKGGVCSPGVHPRGMGKGEGGAADGI